MSSVLEVPDPSVGRYLATDGASRGLLLVADQVLTTRLQVFSLHPPDS